MVSPPWLASHSEKLFLGKLLDVAATKLIWIAHRTGQTEDYSTGRHSERIQN